MHPLAVVKNLGVCFDANFSFADHVRNICKTCFIQMRDLMRVRQYLMDEAAVLVANALVSTHLDYCNSLFRSISSFNMRKLQSIQKTLAIDTHGLVLFSKNSIGCQSNFGVFSKLPLWSTRFFIVVTQTISALVCLFVVGDMAQDTTAQIRRSWRFLNTTHLYTKYKYGLTKKIKNGL